MTNKQISAAFDRRIAEMKVEENKLADAIRLLEQIDFSIGTQMSNLYDRIPWADMERASGYTRNAH